MNQKTSVLLRMISMSIASMIIIALLVGYTNARCPSYYAGQGRLSRDITMEITNGIPYYKTAKKYCRAIYYTTDVAREYALQENEPLGAENVSCTMKNMSTTGNYYYDVFISNDENYDSFTNSEYFAFALILDNVNKFSQRPDFERIYDKYRDDVVNISGYGTDWFNGQSEKSKRQAVFCIILEKEYTTENFEHDYPEITRYVYSIEPELLNG